MPKLFVATKALINHQGQILVLRESNKYIEGTHSGFFDVVGGRITPGERFEECLLREVKEETGLDVKIGRPFFVGEWRPVVKGELWQVIGIFFECFADTNTVVLSDDHDAYKWIDPKNFTNENVISNLDTAFQAYLELINRADGDSFGAAKKGGFFNSKLELIDADSLTDRRGMTE